METKNFNEVCAEACELPVQNQANGHKQRTSVAGEGQVGPRANKRAASVSDDWFHISLRRSGEAPAQQLAGQQEQIKPSRKRYLIMLLFALNWANMAFQWLQIPSSTTKASVMYGVDNYVINLSATTFMLVFVVLSWPACFIVETIGIRRSVICACLAAAASATMKCFSCHDSGLWLMLAGQTIGAMGELLVFSLPTRMASVWFPDHQVSFCVALCVTGEQIGLATGFIVPHWFLEGLETRQEIEGGFYRMFLATTAYSVGVLLLCALLIDEAPQFAPGLARLKQLELERESGKRRPNSLAENLAKLFEQIGRLLRNKQIMLLATSYGIIVGVGWTIATLLDQMLKQVWPDDDLVAGNTGFLVIITGIIAMPLWGRALDYWHAYRLINLILASGLILSLILFASTMVHLKSSLGIYLAAILMGLFQGGFVVAGLEYAVEQTYPAPEMVTSCVMNIMPDVYSIFFINLASYINDKRGVLAANIFLVSLLTLGLVLLLATRQILRRQQAIADAPAMEG